MRADSDTKRRRLEDERRELQKALTLSLSRAAGYRTGLAAVLRKLCEASGWAYSEAWLASRDESLLKPGPVWPYRRVALRRFWEHSRKLGFLRGNDLVGRVLDSRQPEWIEDVAAAPRAVYLRADRAQEAGFGAALAVPISTGRQVLAVLVFYAPETRTEDTALVEFVTDVLSPLGPFLERKKIEEELHIRARQQEAVARLGMEALQDAADIDLLVDRALDAVKRVLEVESGEVLELAPGGGAFAIRAGLDRKDDSVEEGGDTHALFLLAEKEPLAFEDLFKEKRFAAPARLLDRDLASGLCVLIHGHSRPIGVLGAYDTRRRRFTPNDVSFLQGVANVLGSAIERRRAEKELERHRHHLERLVAERTERLEASHEQLRQSERLASIGTLAAGLGHDMKNVLLPILCRLDTLEQAPLSDDALADVKAVRHSLDYLRRLSHGLRLFALDPEDPDATDGVTRIQDWWLEVGPLLERAIAKKVKFRADLPDDLPPVRVPGHRLTQAALNLVVNAGEATAETGTVRVWAQAADDGGQVRFCVTDDGRGMTPHVQRHALEPFFTTRQRGLSTGLGLSLVHGVAKAAGGSVKIYSQPGQGTTVVLMLPAVDEPAEAPSTEEQRPARGVAVSLDDPRTSAFVSTLLRSGGFVVRHVAPDDPGDGILWITEPHAESRRAVLAYLHENPDRRVIVLGSPAWAKPGRQLTLVTDPHDLEGLRKSLRAVVRDLVESTDVF